MRRPGSIEQNVEYNRDLIELSCDILLRYEGPDPREVDKIAWLYLFYATDEQVEKVCRHLAWVMLGDGYVLADDGESAFTVDGMASLDFTCVEWPMLTLADMTDIQAMEFGKHDGIAAVNEVWSVAGAEAVVESLVPGREDSWRKMASKPRHVPEDLLEAYYTAFVEAAALRTKQIALTIDDNKSEAT